MSQPHPTPVLLLRSLIRRIADLWSERGDEIRGSARNVMRQLEEVAARAARGGKGAVSRAEVREGLGG